MTTRRQALAWTAGGALAASSRWSTAQTAPATSDPLADLDSWLEAQRVGWRVPAMAVALVKDGQIIYQRGFGFRDAAQTLPVNTDTLFRGASTTKALGAATVAMLVDEGKLAWDAPVTSYIPELKLAGGEEYRSLNLRDMLSHRSGLPRHELLWYNNQSLTRQGLAARLQHLEMSAPLRARAQYTNLMFVLAGLVVERVTGQSWEAFAKARLLAPLGMQRANFSTQEMARDSNHTTGHTLRGGRLLPVPLRNDPLLGPAGALNASISDYAQWIKLQLGMGQVGTRRLISAASMAAMWEPLIPTSGTPRTPDFQRSHFGLGWRIDRYRETARVAHSGDLNGFTARVMLLPQKNVGCAVLVNHGNHPLPNALTPDLADRLLGLVPEDNSSKVMARRRAAEATETSAETRVAAPSAAPLRDLVSYAGSYIHPGYGEVLISHAAAGLAVRYNDMPAALRHQRDEVFEVRTERPEHGEFNGLKLSFQGTEPARVTGFTALMDQNVQPILVVKAS